MAAVECQGLLLRRRPLRPVPPVVPLTSPLEGRRFLLPTLLLPFAATEINSVQPTVS